MGAARHIGCLSVLALLGCGRGEPLRELRLEVPRVITSRDAVRVQVRAIEADGTPRDAATDLTAQVAPAGLATVNARGWLTCQRSGDGALSVELGGVKGRAEFSCRLVARLEAPDKLVLDAASGEVELPVEVLDDAGKPLDLPVSASSELGSVAQVRSGRLVAGNVGTTKITLRVGSLVRQLGVEVVRTLSPEVVAVGQGRRLHASLAPGKYRLTIRLPAAHEVSVQWPGAPYCDYRAVGEQHRAECTLQGKGGVSYDNPAFLLQGDSQPSRVLVALQEIP